MNVTATGPAIDRRATQRWTVRRPALIFFPQHPRGMRCSVVDESDTGARLADCDTSRCPSEFAFQVPSDVIRECRVVWRSPAAVGVQYREDDRLRRLRQIIAHFERLLARTDEGSEAYRAEIAAAKEMIEQLENAGPSLQAM